MDCNLEGNRRWRLAGLLVGAAALVSAPPILAQEQAAYDLEAATLNIGYFDRAGLPPGVVAAMQAEVERLLAELDVTVLSLDSTDLMHSESQPSGMLVNVLVWERLPEAWDVPRHTLGFCPDAGKKPRSVYVFQRSLLRELGLAWVGIDTARAEDVGRAFGRVVAHEIIHAFATFAGEHRHRGNGLMGSQLDRDTLLRPGLAVDQRSGDAFRAGLIAAAGGR